MSRLNESGWNLSLGGLRKPTKAQVETAMPGHLRVVPDPLL